MAPQVVVRYWAGARRAAGRESEQLSAETVGQLRLLLESRLELAEIMPASTLLVDGVAATADCALTQGATVDVLPPFAGG